MCNNSLRENLKDLNKWRHIPCMYEKVKVVKVSIFPKVIHLKSKNRRPFHVEIYKLI